MDVQEWRVNVFVRCALCRGGAEALYSSDGIVAGTGNIVLDDTTCTGSELSLFLCSHAAYLGANCGHSEDVGVRCGKTRERGPFGSRV